MTTDIKELVRRLDENWGRRRIGDMSCLLADAADALEALAGEVERLSKAHDERLKQNTLERAATHKQFHRAEAAEAERDRLKIALMEARGMKVFYIEEGNQSDKE